MALDRGTAPATIRGMTPQTDIYGYVRTEAQKRYGDVLSGSAEALFVAVTSTDCSTATHDAIEKAARARGYTEGVTWLFFDAAQGLVNEVTLLEIIESLDPICAIVLGQQATELFTQTYRLSESNGYVYAMGRPTCLIPDIEQLLGSDEGRQKIWGLVKALPEL